MNKTALNKSHIELGAKMVNFSNWEMPISYTSLIEEHNAVRNTAGIFDVSHMSIFDFDGGNQVAFFEKIFANDVKKSLKIIKQFMVRCLIKKAEYWMISLSIMQMINLDLFQIAQRGTKIDNGMRSMLLNLA